MTEEKTVDTGIPNLYGEMSQSGRYLCINSPGDYYEIPPCGLIFDCKKALEDEKCFVVFDYPATYNTTTLDGKFLAIGSSFSYITSEYEFSYLTIEPWTYISTNGESGLEQALPGTLLADFMDMNQPYGIYVNPYTGYIYGTDAGSFEGAGYLYQWSPEGRFIGKHKVYINPGHFLALPPEGYYDGMERIQNSKFKIQNDEALYDLQGRQWSFRDYNRALVQKHPRMAPKGIYIKNGKKIFYNNLIY